MGVRNRGTGTMRTAAIACLLAAVAAPALAQTAGPASAPQGSGAPSPICTDRPTRATAVCTVPAGTFQLETDLPNWTFTSNNGVRADVVIPFNPTLKYGLGANTDVQVNWAPYIHSRARVTGFGVASADGVGDVFVRLKQRFTKPADKFQFGLIPYVKLPTAPTRIGGNRHVEGGLVASAQYALAGGWTLTAAPEVDVLLNSTDNSRHAQLAGALNVGKTLTPKLTAYAEIYGAKNYDPAGTVDQASADFALAYLVRPNLQFDAGANIGLNSNTPDAQLYLGVSTTF